MNKPADTDRHPRILYINGPLEDYLGDAILHGLRRLFGSSVVDYPKCEHMYAGCNPAVLKQIRGGGFSLYTGLLEDVPIDRFNIEYKIAAGFFDLVIFADVWRQFGFFHQFLPYLRATTTLVIDGQDSPQLFPYAGRWLRNWRYWTLARAHRRFLYFKREWSDQTEASRLFGLVNGRLARRLVRLRNVRPVSFSFPEEKVWTGDVVKSKEFGSHVVDPEVVRDIGVGQSGYAFTREEDYYADLRRSRFGITTKKAGWECLRHYEIAANACVPAFRELSRKPERSGPFGLNASNCLEYANAAELRSKVSALTPGRYAELLDGSRRWILSQTTTCRALEVLGVFEAFRGFKLPRKVST